MKKSIGVTVEEIPYEDPFTYYTKASANGNAVSLLMESLSKDPRYGKQSIVVAAPSVQVKGTEGRFEVAALNEQGRQIIRQRIGPLLRERSLSDGNYEITRRGSNLEGRISRKKVSGLTDAERLHAPSLATPLRDILEEFEVPDEHAGFYGALAYDFARQHEDVGNRFSGGSPDINLFLPQEVVVFDEMGRRAFVKRYGFTSASPAQKAASLEALAQDAGTSFDLSENEFLDKTRRIIDEIRNGEIIQAVLSRTARMNMQEHPIESYAKLRKLNPSPYSFFFNLGEGEALFGASPEIHVKVSGREVEIRPLAGTIRRSGNPVEDYRAQVELLTDEKETREHSMLVDLARNDISRVSDGVRVYEYLGIEAYPNLYHLGSGVVGNLREGFDALDCIGATLPAGTLSGAPKVRAMQILEELEGSRRGYYGGCIGYVTFRGECNTGITIRSVHVSDGMAYVMAGAGIVLLSEPEKELAEANLKSINQLRVLKAGGVK